jgi:hypothetical protein
MAQDAAPDTVPTATDEPTEPPELLETPTLDPRRVPPEVDVPALTALLDGKYAEVRDLVRRNLATYATVLDEAETLSREEYRDRRSRSSSSTRAAYLPRSLRAPDLVG